MEKYFLRAIIKIGSRKSSATKIGVTLIGWVLVWCFLRFIKVNRSLPRDVVSITLTLKLN